MSAEDFSPCSLFHCVSDDLARCAEATEERKRAERSEWTAGETILEKQKRKDKFKVGILIE